jgi:hypothetical protein
MDMEQRRSILSAPRGSAQQARRALRAVQRWRHPFDTAGGTVLTGVLLTIVLLLALRLLGG